MKLVPATESLALYLANHATALDQALLPGEAIALEELRHETLTFTGSEMQISKEQGSFMYLLAKLTGARKAVELGCFTGYSAIAVAAALPSNGLMVTIDKDQDAMAVARRYFVRTGQSNKISPRLGNVTDELEKLLAEHGSGSFDLAFIDADKIPMLEYFELCLKLLRSGGLILADNTLWNGAVVNAHGESPAPYGNNNQDKNTVAIRHFNDTVVTDRRVEATLVNVADGIMMLRKL